VREIVATLDGNAQNEPLGSEMLICSALSALNRTKSHGLSVTGDAPFPYDGAEGVHACEILLGAPPISCTLLCQ
jgi:hypothetical protein